MNVCHHFRLLPAVAFVLAASCSSGTEPRVRDTFVLQSVAGEALPTLEYINGACGTTLVADTIVLFEDGTGTRITARDVPSYAGAVDPITCEPAASSPRKRSVTRAGFRYQLDGNAISFNFPCNDTASCTPPSVQAGTLSQDGLVVDVSYTGRTPLVYVSLAADHTYAIAEHLRKE